MKTTLRLTFAVLALITITRRVNAADAGDLIFPVDLDRQARAELIYESRSRDLDNGATFESDFGYVRIHTDVGQYAYLDFDAGIINPSGGDVEFYGGIGLRFLAYDGDWFRFTPLAQVHYAPAVELDNVAYDDLLDFDGGLLWAAKIPVNQQLTLMPYIGPVVSLLEVNGDPDVGEENQFGGILGLSLRMPGNNTFRVEAQLFDEVSFSVAAGIAF